MLQSMFTLNSLIIRNFSSTSTASKWPQTGIHKIGFNVWPWAASVLLEAWSFIPMLYFWYKSIDKTLEYVIVGQKYQNMFIPTYKWPPNSLNNIFLLPWAQGFFNFLDETTSNSETLTLSQLVLLHNLEYTLRVLLTNFEVFTFKNY